jgi:hypothetical protein
MAHPPFMNSTGLIPKIFDKISEAQKPERFTTDYLATVIGYGSGSARPVIPLLKRLNFLQADGTPTLLYARFRNPSERASAMLEGMKGAYAELFARNEYAHLMPKEKLRDLVIEVTGLKRDNSVVQAIVSTFLALKLVAGIDDTTRTGGAQKVETVQNAEFPEFPTPTISHAAPDGRQVTTIRNVSEVGMNLSYTINLNLPPSPDPEVFNAIFKALKEHLLGK